MSPNLVEELINIVKDFSRLRGVVIGDVILDEYVFGTVQRISPEAPVPVVTLNGREVHLGGAANVALNLKSLGANVYLFGVVGDDPSGREILELLRNEGISEKGIVMVSDRKTTQKTRVVGRGQQMLRIDNEVTDPIPGRVSKELLSRLHTIREDFDFIIFEDYNKGVLTPSIISHVFNMYKDKLKSVDPKFENFFAYQGCDIFKPNLRELYSVMGFQGEGESSLFELIKETKERIGAKWLVVTRGEKGFVILTDDKVVKVPAWKREVFDVTGAGDTVISVLTLAAQEGAGIVRAAILASLAAGIEVGKFGAATVSPEELIEAVKENAKELEDSIEIM